MAVADHDAGIFTLGADLCVSSNIPMLDSFLALQQAPRIINDSFQILLFSVLSLCFPLLGRAVIKPLAFSLIWYLGPTLLVSQYSKNHLIDKTSNCTFPLFSSERRFVERRKNGTYPFVSSRIGFYSLDVMASQFLQYPRVIKLFILVCVVILILIIVHKIKQLIGDATQEHALRQLIPGVAECVGGVGQVRRVITASDSLGFHT